MFRKEKLCDYAYELKEGLPIRVKNVLLPAKVETDLIVFIAFI